MRGRRRTGWGQGLVWGCTLVFLFLLGAEGAQAQEADAVQRALDRAYQAESYDLAGDFEGGRLRTEPSPPGDFPSEGLDSLIWVVLGILLVGGIVVLILILRGGSKSSPKARRQRAPAKRRPAPAPRRATPQLSRAIRISDAQVAFDRGETERAIHLLLLAALPRVAASLGLPLPEADTSREILRRIGRGAPVRPDFETLVRTVEVCRFGGHPATESLYHQSLESCTRILDGRAVS